MKRKGTFETKPQSERLQKKHKRKEESHESPKPVQLLEAETDSDPIIESGTTSQSGEDDGGSWPSENESGGENEEVESWDGASEGGNGVEGAEFDIRAANAQQGKPKPDSTDGVGTGKSF